MDSTRDVPANRRRRVRWCLGGVLGLLIWGGLSGTGAEERLQEEAQKGRWLFPPGRIEWGAQAGGGFALSDYATPLLSLGARVGYVLTEQEVFLRGSLEIVGEPSYFGVVHGRTAHGGDLSAFLKYNFWTGTKLTPYLIGGAGLSYASIRVPQGGTNFQFHHPDWNRFALCVERARDIKPRVALSPFLKRGHRAPQPQPQH